MVTILVLAASAGAAFAWTAAYVGSVTSAARHASRGSGPAQAGGAAAVPPGLSAKVDGAVWKVQTFDVNGEPSAGSAFAVASNASETLLIASYSVVSAATYQPAPPVKVSRAGVGPVPVTLRAWDPTHDLALLVLSKGDQPVLRGAGSTPPSAGEAVYAVGGTGAITAGKLRNVSPSALEDDVEQHSSSRGGPLVDGAGEVLGVDSAAYEPASAPAAAPGSNLAVPIQEACAVVVVCPGGKFPSSTAG